MGSAVNTAMNADAAASEPFTFVVGPQNREFKIHSAIVASLSEYLQKLVDGQFLEGSTRKVSWPHVEEDIFVCFWQFAYTSNYDLRNFDTREIVKDGIASKTTEPQAASTLENTWDETPPQPAVEAVVEDYWVPRKKKGRMTGYSTKQERLWSRFSSLRRDSSDPHTNQVGQAAEVDGQQKRHLLYHAKVYTFSECYGITPLMLLSYNKLHQSLTGMQDANDMAEFVALTQFCYESIVPDKLKELVVIFAACEIERLWLEEQFQDLLEAHGQLSKSVIGSLRSRLE